MLCESGFSFARFKISHRGGCLLSTQFGLQKALYNIAKPNIGALQIMSPIDLPKVRLTGLLFLFSRSSK